jgi:hypothetical protein
MVTRSASLVYIDFAPQHRQPNRLRVLIASVAAIAGSRSRMRHARYRA